MINKSGIIPLSYKVLIKVRAIEEKTSGGIIIPDEIRDKEGAASQVATIIDKGPAAFTVGVGDLKDEWNLTPGVGNEIVINKYAGIQVKGIDGEEYRLVSDKEVLAILTEK